MGQGTDAILFYGFHAEEGDWDEAIGDDWEEKFAARKGVSEPDVEYDTDEHKALHGAYWKAKRELLAPEPCEVDSHCSGDCPMPLVCIKASKIRACRGGPQEINSLAVAPEWDVQLKTFCDLMGIPWQEPRWWLASDWN